MDEPDGFGGGSMSNSPTYLRSRPRGADRRHGVGTCKYADRPPGTSECRDASSNRSPPAGTANPAAGKWQTSFGFFRRWPLPASVLVHIRRRDLRVAPSLLVDRPGQGTVMNAGNSHRHGATLLARMLVAITLVFGMASVQAEIFNESPARMIGPANDVPICASIGGQGGWAVSCSPTKYDEEISHDRARAGMQSWRVSNWFHEGCVNSVLSPAFASVAEGSSPNNSIVNSFWFNVPAGNAGLTISASLGDAPGQRLTYAAIIDDGATLRVQAVGILNGSGFAGPPLPAPFDDPGVEYQIANSSPLA